MRRLAEPDAISICVPTPLSKFKDPDVSYIVAATEAVKQTLRRGQAIILESTTYPGTTREILLPALESTGPHGGRGLLPRLQPRAGRSGQRHTTAPGTRPRWSAASPRTAAGWPCALYQPAIDTLVPVSTTEAAELVKLLENTFRSVNIGLVNEMAIVCDKLGVDVWEVIEAAATKPFGFMKFLPGPGLGGHCIPIDPHYLAWKMRGLNYKTRFIDLAGELNTEMPLFWVRKVAEALNGQGKAVRGASVLVLGRRLQAGHRRHPGEPGARHHPPAGGPGGAESAIRPARAASSPRTGTSSARWRSTPKTVAAADCVMIVTDHTAVDYRMIKRHAQAGGRHPQRNAERGSDMHVAVIGSGYVGLVAGACLAETGNDVVCVDVDAEKIARLQRNEIPIYEPGSSRWCKRNQEEGRLTFTTDLASAVRERAGHLHRRRHPAGRGRLGRPAARARRGPARSAGT